MRSMAAVAFAVILIGCGDKGKPTPAPLELQSNRETPPEQTPPSTKPAPDNTPPTANKNQPKVEIAKAKVSINGTPVAIPAQLPVLEKLLGKPSGIVDDPVSEHLSIIYWNGLGISGRQDKKGKQELRELSFSFVVGWDVSAKSNTKPFPGELILEGQPVTKDTDPAELSKNIRILRKSFGKWYSINYDESPLQVTVSLEDKTVTSVTVEQPLAARN